jgi:hypothetical protein
MRFNEEIRAKLQNCWQSRDSGRESGGNTIGNSKLKGQPSGFGDDGEEEMPAKLQNC